MKTVKYYIKKYEPLIVKEKTDKFVVYQHVNDLFVEINKELQESYGALPESEQTKDAFMKMMYTANTRWNEIGRKFQRRQGDNPLKKDAFLSYWIQALNSGHAPSI